MKLRTSSSTFSSAPNEDGVAGVTVPELVSESEETDTEPTDSANKKLFTVDICFTNKENVSRHKFTVPASTLIVAVGRGAREAKKLLPKHSRFSEVTLTVYRHDEQEE